MKLASIHTDRGPSLAFASGSHWFITAELPGNLPDTMERLLSKWDAGMDQLRNALRDIEAGAHQKIPFYEWKELIPVSPIPRPLSIRDGYAFRQHVETARRNRGVPMIPAFDQFPVFYFSNAQAVSGSGELEVMPDHLVKLDFELEVAVLICREGKNIRAAEAGQWIGGFMIMNDFSARAWQMEEMQLNLGPAKGKDFATTLGPWLVTPDELESRILAPPAGHAGNSWDLGMRAYVNDELFTDNTLASMNWTFAELIERASYGVTLYPGEIIGSGTVGGGCLLEINGTRKRENPEARERWLQPGDLITLEIDGLGRLENRIVASRDPWTIRK
jgi:fumarylacetoacetate (FAA) hydrolase